MKNKYCLDSVLPFKSINQSPINRSKAKQTYSFSKAHRFHTILPTCPLVSYCGDQIKRKDSGPSMGYGKKHDLTQQGNFSPPSNTYRIKTLFDENQMSRKGFSLRLNRQQVTSNSYINPQLAKIPGVGKYNFEKQRVSTQGNSPIYTMRPKTKVINKLFSIEPINDNPSSANYYLPRRLNTITYSNCKSKRFDNMGKVSKYVDNRIPGPGQYNSNRFINTGKSIIHNGNSIRFDHSKRVTEFDQASRKGSIIPGPGSYRLGSQFGQYDGDVYNRDTSKSRYN